MSCDGATIPRGRPRRYRPALAGQVEHDGGGFGQRQPVIVDRRDLLEGAEPAIGLGAEVVRGVVHAGQLERQLHLFERPQHAQVAGVAAGDALTLEKP